MALESQNVVQAGSPEWWLLRLGNQLDARAKVLAKLENYYIGDHPLPEGNRRARQLFKQLQRQARTNYCELAVDAPRERLKVVGFSNGSTGSDDADKESWRIWQANKLDANSGINHTNVLKYGIGYMLVGPNAKKPDTPIITVEDPREVIHASDPLDFRKVRAALKTWYDDVTQLVYAIVYLPGSINYFVSANQISPASVSQVNSATRWSAGYWNIEKESAVNPLGEVTLVPFLNRPNGKGFGKGEFEGVIDIQDRINTQVLDKLVISKMQAYRQRWAKGIATTDENGVPVQPFIPGVDLLWATEEDNAQFGDFQEANLLQILASIRDDVQDFASISKTPPHYLLSGIVNASGDTLAAAETGLVSKVMDMHVELGESYEDVNRYAGKYAGRDVPEDAETLWRDPTYRTVGELADAAVKKQSAGVPWRTRMRDLQYSPPEIDRMQTERVADAMLEAQFPQLEAPGTPVRYTTTDATKTPPGNSSSPAPSPSTPAVRPSDLAGAAAAP